MTITRTYRFMLPLALACVLADTVTGAQDSAAASELAALDRRLQEAAVIGDAALLDRHLAPDFMFTHAGGATDTKAHWVKLASARPPRYLARTVSRQAVEIHDDVGIVFGRLDVRAPAATGAAAVPRCYSLNYVHVYGRRDGRWMFLSHRTTQMIEESHPCR